MALFQPDVNGPNLQSIFDLVGPGSAGQYFGEQNQARQDMNGINQQLSLGDLDKINQENAQTRIVNPYLADEAAAKSREANSKTTGFFNQMRQGDMGKARADVVAGNIAEQTQGSTVNAKNAGNIAETIAHTNTQLTQLGAYIKTLPMSERHAAFEQLAEQHGIKGPVFDKMMRLGPVDLGNSFDALVKNSMEADPKLLAELTKGREHNAAEITVGAGHDSASRYATDQKGKGGGAKLITEYLKADGSKKADYIISLVRQAQGTGEDTVTLPTGEEMKLPDAFSLAQELIKSTRGTKAVGRPQVLIPGMPMTDPSTQPGYDPLTPGQPQASKSLSDAELLAKHLK